MATSTEHTGAMIALVPSDESLVRLAIDEDGVEPLDELHLTLYYLGDAAAIDAATRQAMRVAITNVVERREVPAFRGNAFGVAHWNPASDDPAWVLNVGDVPADERDESLAYARTLVDEALSDGGVDLAMPPQHTPWQPHICIVYSADDWFDELQRLLGDVTFDRVRLAFGSEVTDVPLRRAATVASTSGGTIVSESAVETTVAEPVDLVDESGSESDVVTAASDVPQDDCPEGHRKLPNGECISPEEYAVRSAWHGVLVVEGVPTGDGREFSPDALSWADNALLRWQKEGSHGGDHDVTVSVGRIDKVWRVGNQVMGSGVIDIESVDGFEVARRLGDNFAGGISIDADDIQDADVELVWGDAEGADEDDPLLMLFGRPEKVVYHAGRVRAATLCDIPAFVEARIALGALDESQETLAASATITGVSSAVVLAHTSDTVDSPWDHATTFRRLPNIVPLEIARGAFAYVADPVGNRVAKTTCAYLHHEINDDGTVGPANLTACAAAIHALRSWDTSATDEDKAAIYGHLAQHLRDAGQEPPPLDESALTAAIVIDDWRPQREWFDDPKFSVHTGITVTDEGRVYGHAAPWGECHIGFADQCITLPREEAHPYFMTGEVVCADGSRVAVGQITVGTGHAPLTYRASHAAEHYDNTGAAVADVAVGNDKFGLWVAGAIRPSVAASRVHELRASGRLSGDWRKVGGQLRLVGLLAVNVPGFPIPATRARVASGAPQALVAAGATAVVGPGPRVVEVSDDELDRRAMRRVMSILATRVRRQVQSPEGVQDVQLP